MELQNSTSERSRILNEENVMFLGGNLVLDESERKLDSIIVKIKSEELELSYKQSDRFLPTQHFFKAKAEIEKSKLFKLLREMPKGCSLHTHLLAAASVDYIIENLTHDENIYGKVINDIFKLKYMKPEEAEEGKWTPLKELREKNTHFDAWLKTQLTLIDEHREVCSLETIWSKFKKTFSTTYDMLSYKPAFEEYFYQCLKELWEDNVMYCEFRGTIQPLYDLAGNVYTAENFFQLMVDVERKFKDNHSSFFGVRYIHSFYRGISIEDLKKEMSVILEMKKKFPKLIAGIDFVGFEEEGHSLIDFRHEIEKVKDELNFFFHAGETNWFGHTDINIMDAILLQSKRIGHGFALSKHPVLMDMVKKQNIAIEHCPISNQILLLNEDPRNHPVVGLLARGFPVVVCNDDPATWGSSGLSYDWYVTFLAMTPKGCGLKFLKQLALNSIKYSALDEEVDKTLDIWNKKWNSFVIDMLGKLGTIS